MSVTIPICITIMKSSGLESGQPLEWPEIINIILSSLDLPRADVIRSVATYCGMVSQILCTQACLFAALIIMFISIYCTIHVGKIHPKCNDIPF